MLAVQTVTWAIAAVATSRSRLLPMVQGTPAASASLAIACVARTPPCLPGYKDSTSAARCRSTARASCGVKTLSSAMRGTPLRRRAARRPPSAGGGAARGGLRERAPARFPHPRPPPRGLPHREPAVGVHRQPDVRPNGLTHRLQALHVVARMHVAADLDLDRSPA